MSNLERPKHPSTPAQILRVLDLKRSAKPSAMEVVWRCVSPGAIVPSMFYPQFFEIEEGPSEPHPGWAGC